MSYWKKILITLVLQIFVFTNFSYGLSAASQLSEISGLKKELLQERRIFNVGEQEKETRLDNQGCSGYLDQKKEEAFLEFELFFDDIDKMFDKFNKYWFNKYFYIIEYSLIIFGIFMVLAPFTVFLFLKTIIVDRYFIRKIKKRENQLKEEVLTLTEEQRQNIEKEVSNMKRFKRLFCIITDATIIFSGGSFYVLIAKSAQFVPYLTVKIMEYFSKDSGINQAAVPTGAFLWFVVRLFIAFFLAYKIAENFGGIFDWFWKEVPDSLNTEAEDIQFLIDNNQKVLPGSEAEARDIKPLAERFVLFIEKCKKLGIEVNIDNKEITRSAAKEFKDKFRTMIDSVDSNSEDVEYLSKIIELGTEYKALKTEIKNDSVQTSRWNIIGNFVAWGAERLSNCYEMSAKKLDNWFGLNKEYLLKMLPISFLASHNDPRRRKIGGISMIFSLITGTFSKFLNKVADLDFDRKEIVPKTCDVDLHGKPINCVPIMPGDPREDDYFCAEPRQELNSGGRDLLSIAQEKINGTWVTLIGEMHEGKFKEEFKKKLREKGHVIFQEGADFDADLREVFEKGKTEYPDDIIEVADRELLRRDYLLESFADLPYIMHSLGLHVAGIYQFINNILAKEGGYTQQEFIEASNLIMNFLHIVSFMKLQYNVKSRFDSILISPDSIEPVTVYKFKVGLFFQHNTPQDLQRWVQEWSKDALDVLEKRFGEKYDIRDLSGIVGELRDNFNFKILSSAERFFNCMANLRDKNMIKRFLKGLNEMTKNLDLKSKIDNVFIFVGNGHFVNMLRKLFRDTSAADIYNYSEGRAPQAAQELYDRLVPTDINTNTANIKIAKLDSLPEIFKIIETMKMKDIEEDIKKLKDKGFVSEKELKKIGCQKVCNMNSLGKFVYQNYKDWFLKEVKDIKVNYILLDEDLFKNESYEPVLNFTAIMELLRYKTRNMLQYKGKDKQLFVMAMFIWFKIYDSNEEVLLDALEAMKLDGGILLENFKGSPILDELKKVIKKAKQVYDQIGSTSEFDSNGLIDLLVVEKAFNDMEFNGMISSYVKLADQA